MYLDGQVCGWGIHVTGEYDRWLDGRISWSVTRECNRYMGELTWMGVCVGVSQVSA